MEWGLGALKEEYKKIAIWEQNSPPKTIIKLRILKSYS